MRLLLCFGGVSLKDYLERLREYERRKKELQRQNLTSDEYQEAVKAIADELGI